MYVVKCILEWAITTTKELQDEYLIVLKRELESLDVDGLLQTIDRIYEWKDYRNEVIHALMNKSMESLDYGIKDKVDEGMELARFVDGQVRIIKKKNKIREILNLE